MNRNRIGWPKIAALIVAMGLPILSVLYETDSRRYMPPIGTVLEHNNYQNNLQSAVYNSSKESSVNQENSQLTNIIQGSVIVNIEGRPAAVSVNKNKSYARYLDGNKEAVPQDKMFDFIKAYSHQGDLNK